MKDKIRILFLAADPINASRMRLGEELREISDRLEASRYGDAFDLRLRMAVRPSDLQEALLKHEPHIVHYSGHANKRGIILQDEDGKMKRVKKDKLANMFRLLNEHIRIVVLNACYTRLEIDAFTTAIDFTIAMNEKIGDRAAIFFAAAFYRALAYGRSVQNAFDLAVNNTELQGVRYTGMAELLSKEGCNAAQVYLVNQPLAEGPGQPAGERPIKFSDLEVSLQKILSGTMNSEDQQKLQQAVASGQLVFTAEERQPAAESDERLPIIRSHRNQVNVTISQNAYERLQGELFPEPRGLAPPFPTLIFVGREGALADLKRTLGMAGLAARRSPFTILRGWPGVGKTTLAGILGRDADTRRAFPDGVLWTSLGQRPGLISELAKWGRALGTDELLRVPTLKDATTQLRLLLQHKRMLLIVDDVWTPGDAQPFIEACGETNALLITTREHLNVAEALDVFRPDVYLLPILDEENALKLLRILAPVVVEQHADECRELVNALECLPLALHVAGSLLKNEAKLGWGVSDLLKEIKQGAAVLEARPPADRIEQGERPTVKALLQKSTDLLTDFTRGCFAYLGPMAPKPATFDLAAMKAMWKVDDPKPIVRELVGHGLLEPVGGGRFQMHALLVAHAKSMLT